MTLYKRIFFTLLLMFSSLIFFVPFASFGNEDPYKILGVSKTASLEEIKSAYKRMVKKYHPDLYKGKDADIKMQNINAAYDRLTKRNNRASFQNGRGEAYQQTSGGLADMLEELLEILEKERARQEKVRERERKARETEQARQRETEQARQRERGKQAREMKKWKDGLMKEFDIEAFKTAIWEEDTKTVSDFLAGGLNINGLIKDDMSWTPLHMAVSWRRVIMAEFLIENGADVNARDNSHVNSTPLHYATRSTDKENVDMIRLLISAGADVDAGNYRGETPLMYAAESGFVESIMVMKAGADVKAKDIDGMTPLHWVAKQSSVANAELLISAGADVNARSKYDLTPLHVAAGNGHADMVKFLIDKGADVNARDSGKKPSYSVSRFYGGPSHLTLERSRLKAKDKRGQTPLMLAKTIRDVMVEDGLNNGSYTEIIEFLEERMLGTTKELPKELPSSCQNPFKNLTP